MLALFTIDVGYGAVAEGSKEIEGNKNPADMLTKANLEKLKL